jgi:hypothetical protein
MKPAAAPRSATYAASRRKTFHSTLCHLLQTEFPGTFGPTITRLFADKISELFERCHPPLARVKMGQVLWLAVAANETPGRSKRIEQTRLVPVLLDLVTAADIDAAAALADHKQTRCDKIVRLFRQAHAQGAVLSEADVALLMHLHDTAVSADIRAYEQAGNRMVPRRGTIHDLGRSVTHKAVICRMRLVDKKTTSEVAEATYHSPEEVEYYVQCLRRIQRCSDSGMSLEDIALVTGHSLFLIREYLALIEELGLLPSVDPS